jgi:hypothetical protein
MTDADDSAVVDAVAARDPWSRGQLIGFRFLFAYLILYGLRAFEGAWRAPVEWVGRVAGAAVPIAGSVGGSGDGLFAYVQILTIVLVAGVVAGIWSGLEPGRREHRLLLGWLRILVRFYLGLVMFAYGLAKIFLVQFSAPTPLRLMQNLGDFSPMGLLWVFMGYSPAYSIFTGAAEALGAVLLFSRRTTTLGALVLVGVLTNVVALNLCYDVPVKINSMHLLALSLLLAAPDLGRLGKVLVLNRPTGAAPPDVPRFATRRARAVALVGKGLAVAIGVAILLFVARQPARRAGQALDGLYDVPAFARDGQTIAPNAGGNGRWTRVAIERGALGVQLEDGSVLHFGARHDAREQTLTLSDLVGPRRSIFHFQQTADGFALTGDMIGATAIRLRRLPPGHGFRLIDRGFHWVNTAPFNR